MILTKNIKVFLLSTLTVFLLVTLQFSSTFAVQDARPTTQQKLNGISEEEKKVLETLFNLTQEVDVAEKEEASLSLEIENKSLEIKNIETAIKKEEISYSKKQEGLKQVLRTYQRMGPGTYLEIILDSDSLASFLQRINTLRDLTRNTGELLKDLEVSRDKLTQEKKVLNDSLVIIKEKEQQAKASLTKIQQLKQKQEDYLVSLKGEREFYQQHLTNIQDMIKDLKPFLSNAANEFANIIKSGSLRPEDFKLSFSLLDIKGSIEEKVLNDIVSKQPGFPKMTFSFHQRKAEVSFPERNLVVSGKFIVENGHTLKFQAEEGSFYGLPLEADYIKELFGETGLAIDFEAIIGKIVINSVETKEGSIEVTVKLGSFQLNN